MLDALTELKTLRGLVKPTRLRAIGYFENMLKPTLTWNMCVNSGIGEDYRPNNPVTLVVHLLYRTLLQATYLAEEGVVLSKPDVYIHNPRVSLNALP
jgi:hypothetical protein